MEDDVRFIKLLTGFSNVELTFDWLKYWNYKSFYLSFIFIRYRREDACIVGEVIEGDRVARVEEGFSFMDWYGCD